MYLFAVNNISKSELVWVGIVIGVLVVAYVMRRWVPLFGLIFDVMVFGIIIWSIVTLSYFRYKDWL